MLTRSQFADWLQARRDAGETLAAIGDSFGVSHVTVTHWLSGKRNPSRMALALAGEICRAPIEMAAGLPSQQEPFSDACASGNVNVDVCNWTASSGVPLVSTSLRFQPLRGSF